MKKFTLFLSLLFFAMLIQAQIVITSDDLATPGAKIYEALDTIPGPAIIPGPAGPNQTWDFSTLEEDTVMGIRIRKPDWTPYGAYFPDANYCMEQQTDDTVFTMMNLDISTFSIVGMVVHVTEFIDTTVIFRLNPPQVVAEFPVEYLNARTDTTSYEIRIPFNEPPVDSMMIKYTQINQMEVDAWGTMIIPLGTFEVLRIDNYEIDIDSISVKIGPLWILQDVLIDTSERYAWWSNDESTGIYLVQIQTLISEKEEISDVFFLKSFPTYGINDHQAENNLLAYPNPAGSQITFKTGVEINGIIEIMDATGVNRIMVSCMNVKEQQVDVKDLPSGLYLYRIVDSEKGIIHSGKFLKK